MGDNYQHVEVSIWTNLQISRQSAMVMYPGKNLQPCKS